MKTDRITITLHEGMRERLAIAREAGASYDLPEASFCRHLLAIGLAHYEKKILPLERREGPEAAESLGRILDGPWNPRERKA